MTSAVPQMSYANGIDRSGAVLGLGLLLIVVNLAFTPEGSAVIGSIFGKSVPTGAPTVKWYDVIMQFGFLFVLVLFAKADEEAGNVALLFIGALWVLWILFNQSSWVPVINGPFDRPHPGTQPDTTTK